MIFIHLHDNLIVIFFDLIWMMDFSFFFSRLYYEMCNKMWEKKRMKGMIVEVICESIETRHIRLLHVMFDLQLLSE